jgi:hypothetical protein
LKYYNKYKQAFSKVVSTTTENINSIKVTNYVITYKESKVKTLVGLLDTKIKQEMSKPKYIPEDVKKFYEAYNKFKLAVRYMKEINKTE